MKILCVCQRGNKRSVALASLLKDEYRHDVLSAGWQSNSDETLEMLSSWAERIIVVQASMVERIAEKYRSKVLVFDVGLDVWSPTFDADLLLQLETFIQKAKNELGEPW